MDKIKFIEINNYKKFEYLNLEINNLAKRIISLDRQKHICYIRDNNYTHMLHSGNQHLNSITDLIIELGNSLQQHNEKYYNLMQLISDSMVSRNKKLQQINDDQDYLKTSIQRIDEFDITIQKLAKKFKALNLKSFPNKQDIISLKQMIEENKPKEIEIQSKDLILQIKNQSESNEKQFTIHMQKLEKMLQEIKYIQLN